MRTPLPPIFVSVDKARERSDICRSCDNFRAGFCKECGCFLKFKVVFANVDCPINKWTTEYPTDLCIHTVSEDLSSIEESTTTWDNWKAIE
jgi:hypothetical protein